ncbi:hypothetical protein FWC63_01865 [Candidatus Saccharibacteria bacterium]|nr:hypothetical protein [Candidatus Saccharibacteria bacterium]
MPRGKATTITIKPTLAVLTVGSDKQQSVSDNLSRLYSSISNLLSGGREVRIHHEGKEVLRISLKGARGTEGWFVIKTITESLSISTQLDMAAMIKFIIPGCEVKHLNLKPGYHSPNGCRSVMMKVTVATSHFNQALDFTKQLSLSLLQYVMDALSLTREVPHTPTPNKKSKDGNRNKATRPRRYPTLASANG